MWFKGISLFVLMIGAVVENRMLPIYYETEAPVTEDVQTIADISEEGSNENTNLITAPPSSTDDTVYKINEEIKVKNNKPCAIVVLSNVQNPTMQSLLRKYRYDANGILIPSSVKYFIKMPQGLKSPSILIPLNDKAFSPLGGFVRYYKEVPPIPHAW